MKSTSLTSLLTVLHHLRFPAQIIAISIVVSFFNVYPQTAQGVNHAFHNKFVFGVDGGITIPQTDYEKNKIGYSLRLSGEYFLKTNSIHLVGLKLKIGSEEVTGEDSRTTISTQDGQRNIPPVFKTSVFSAGLAATYSISINDVFFPFISAGFTELWFDPKDNNGKPAEGNSTNLYNRTANAISFEGGFKVLVSDRVSINISANPYILSTDYLDDIAAAFENDSYTSVLVGFSYSPFVESDSDGDGVVDSEDMCPETPYGISVDEFGCPVDTDKDGVPDYIDECPGTPVGTTVDQKGCPLDSDGDGVVDSEDMCPETPYGVSVDEFGCPVEDEIVSEQKITIPGDDIFPPNSAMVKIEGKKYLDEVILQLQKFTDKRWRIEGHMDSVGDTKSLMTLSFERAKAILEYFSFFGGLNRENFQVFGMGADYPIDDNNTEEGRKQNRRIEIVPETTDVRTDSLTKPEEEFNQFILRGDDSFESNTATLKELAKILLDEIAAFIKNQPESRWRIEGYTDNQGSASLQKKITTERAYAIYDYLIAEGLSADQFTVSGLGSSNPIANNDTEEGRSANRRILIIRED